MHKSHGSTDAIRGGYFGNSCGPMRTQDERYDHRFDHGLQTLSGSISLKNDTTETREQGRAGRGERTRRERGGAGRREGDDDDHDGQRSNELAKYSQCHSSTFESQAQKQQRKNQHAVDKHIQTCQNALYAVT